jgi:hypothetical protein
VGKQTIHVKEDDIARLFKKYDVPTANFQELVKHENKDTSTRHRQDSISDEALYRGFCDAHYQCLDISDYEGATLIHDMNEPVPEQYHNGFHFIYNGSVMDNLFDPITFIKNTSKMLKPGGRILHLEAMTNVTGSFLMFSPEWFFSYYAINQFDDCKVYAFRIDEANSRFYFDADLFAWNPYFTRDEQYDYLTAAKAVDGYMYLLVVAEKGLDSTSDRHPQQMQYLHDGAVDWREMYHQFSKNSRPKMDPGYKKRKVLVPFETDHFEYLGSKF